MNDEIRAQLVDSINEPLVAELLENYAMLKHCYVILDWEKCLVRSGKFCETVIKILHFLRSGNIIVKISVEKGIREVENDTSIPESLRLIVTHAVKLIYDFRSKRGGAHGSFNPNFMDCMVVTSNADWILAEFVRVFCVKDPELSLIFVENITSKNIPAIEVLDGDYLVVKAGLSARKEVAMILYNRYPERTMVSQLRKWAYNHSMSNISTSLGNMKSAKLVHGNSEGYVLTRAGIMGVEKDVNAGIY